MRRCQIMIKVGLTFPWWGNGQMDSVASGGAPNISFFSGLWNYTSILSAYTSATFQEGYMGGPPIAGNFTPAATTTYAGDRFGINGVTTPILNESAGAFEQDMTNAIGWPASITNMARDGVGIQPSMTGNQPQTQSIAVGDGVKTVYCSQSLFCANVGVAGKLTYTAANLTGGWFTGSVSGTTLTVGASGWLGGAMAPGFVLSGAGIAGTPHLVVCLTNCTPSSNGNNSTWTLDTSLTIGSEAMRVDPVGGAVAPNLNMRKRP